MRKNVRMEWKLRISTTGHRGRGGAGEPRIPVELPPDHVIALTGLPFESTSVPDVDHAAFVIDQTLILKLARRHGYAGARDAQHVREVLLRQGKPGGVGAVGADQKPARQTLLQRMHGVASDRLSGLEEPALNIAQDAMVEIGAAIELNFDGLHRAGKAPSAELHGDTVRASTASHQGGNSDDGFIPEHADLDLGTVDESCGHGPDTLFEKNDLSDWSAGEFEILVDFELHLAEIQTPDGLRRQMPEHRVLVMIFSHMPPRPGTERTAQRNGQL